MQCQSNLRSRFLKILRPSQNIWTLNWTSTVQYHCLFEVKLLQKMEVAVNAFWFSTFTDLGTHLWSLFPNKSMYVQFRFFEKVTKIWRYWVNVKKGGRFFQIVWSSQNVLTLEVLFIWQNLHLKIFVHNDVQIQLFTCWNFFTKYLLPIEFLIASDYLIVLKVSDKNAFMFIINLVFLTKHC